MAVVCGVVGAENWQSLWALLPYRYPGGMFSKHVSPVFCLASSMNGFGHGSDIRYNSDLYQIVIDSCESTCFTNNMKDFVEKPTKIKQKVRGLGKAVVNYKGMVKWSVLDDQGRTHKFKIPEVHYHPELPFLLLSPQRLSQIKNNSLHPGALALGKHVKLFWDKRKFKRTLPLNHPNIAMIWSAPGNSWFAAFAAQFDEPVCVTDVESEKTVEGPNCEQQQPQDAENKGDTGHPQQVQKGKDDNSRNAPLHVEFFDEQTPVIGNERSSITAKQAKLL
jgi:hypothetical protein